MSNLILGDSYTLTKGIYSLTGELVKIYTSPQIQKNKAREELIRIPDGSTSDFLVVGTAGYRLITIDVPMIDEIKDNPILSDILGIITYDINDEIYTIVSIEAQNINGKIYSITLANNQILTIDPDDPIFPSTEIEFLLYKENRPSAPYTITNIVRGSTIELLDKHTLKVKIYKYSDDDVYLTKYANFSQMEMWKGGMSIKQNYSKNGNDEIEELSAKFMPGFVGSVYIENPPYNTIDDSGVSTGEVTYYFTAVNGISRNFIIENFVYFIIDADVGNFDYYEALGWERSSANVQLYEHMGQETFIIPDNGPDIEYLKKPFTLENIQSLHLDNSTFGCTIALDLNEGNNGSYLLLGTTKALSILNSNGENAFTENDKRRITIQFAHDGTNVKSGGITFNGTDTVDVINEKGTIVTNTVPEILADSFFNAEVRIPNGLNNTMFLYVDDILIGNSSFNPVSNAADYLEYTSGSGGGTERVSYIKKFGVAIKGYKIKNGV